MFKYVIFDLDETLYPRGAGLMQEIGVRILRYLIERMGFSPDQAEAKRMYYYRKYGTSLRGLMVEGGVGSQVPAEVNVMHKAQVVLGIDVLLDH